jgi:hypothetical protein
VLAAAQPSVPLDTFWVRHYEGNLDDTFNFKCKNMAADIIFDTIRRAVYTAGQGEDNYPGNEDMLVAAYRDDGTYLSAFCMGGLTLEDDDMVHTVLLGPDGSVYAGGSTYNVANRFWDASLFRTRWRFPDTTPPDTFLGWFKSTLPKDDYAFDMVLGTRNDIYLVGTNDTTTSGYIGYALAVTRVSRANYARIWTKGFVLDTLAFGAPRRRGLDMHPGFWEDYEWSDYENCATAVALCPDGNIVVTGFGTSNLWGYEWWTMKLDSAGNQLWARTFHDTLSIGDDSDDDIALDIAVASNGDIYVCGFTYRDEPGNNDQGDNFTVVRYSSNGTELRARTFNIDAVDGDDYAYSICLDDSSAQNVYACGVVDHGSALGTQATVMKFDSTLDSLRWGTLGAYWGGSGDDAAYEVTYKHGRVYVVGRRGAGTMGSTSDDILVLSYTAANGSPKDTLWGRFYAHADGLEDFASAIFVADSNNIYVGGQCERVGISTWNSMWTARYGHPYRDVRAVQILAPIGTIPVGSPAIRPIARVQNVGTTTATFQTRISIIGPAPTLYDTFLNVSLAPGAYATDTFARTFNPTVVGMYIVRCSTAYDGDMVQANNLVVDTFYVVSGAADVGVTHILAPAGVVEYGAGVAPRCSVRNFSAVAIPSVPVRMTLPGYVVDTTVALGANQRIGVTWPNWTAGPPGWDSIISYTYLTGDPVRTNDTARSRVWVRGLDVAVRAVTQPPESVDAGASVPVQARVRNMRNVAVPAFQMMMRIAGGYFATVNVAGLAPNESTLVNFPNWGPVTPGWAAIKCSLYCAADTFLPNDTLKDSSYVRGPDVGVTAILAPLDSVDMGAVITPQAVVRNYRSVAVYGVPVKLNIGAAYADSLTVDLAAGGVDTVAFRDWTAAPVGLVRESCYTRMTGDVTRSNDTARAWVYVRAPDCGVSAILAPTGAVEYGASVTPQAVVRNYRSVALNVPVKFAIQGGYQDSVTVALTGYQTDTVAFADWNATTLGLRRESCFTRLATDGNRANDTARATVWVRGRDVGITAILSPPDSADLGGVYVPQAVVRNFRDVAVPVVPVRMYIGMGYNNVVNIALGPNQVDTVDFPNWNAAALGAFTVRCTLAVAGDSFLPNDTMSKVTIVRGPDVGAFRLLAPVGTYVPGTIVTPRARVRNYRSVAQLAVPVRMRIGTGYQRDTTVAIPAGDSLEVAFPDWTANPPGMHAVKCSTFLSTDVYPPNDPVSGTVFVASRDVACQRIVAPVGTVDSGTTVTPQAWIRNFGNTAEVFNCRMLIGSFYADTVSVSLAAYDSVLRSFRPVTLNLLGRWAVNCSTMLAADLVPENDRAVDSVLVRVFDVAARLIVAPQDTVDSGASVVPQLRVANLGSTVQTFWNHFQFQPGTGPVFYHDSVQVTLAPAAESVLTFAPSQPVNQFGTWRMLGWCAARDPFPQNDTARGQFIVPARGGIQWPHGWHEVAPMPPLPSLRPVKDGGALTVMEDSVAGLIYATKGNKTAEFFAYNCLTNTWATLKQIPTGREGKLTGKGTQVCADGAGSIYLTKGNNTLGWWRYTVARDSWTQLTDVPLGTSGKKVKGGTDMAFVVKDDIGYVYLLKGYRDEFHRYNTASDSWQTMVPAPGVAKWDKGSFLVYDHQHTVFAHKAKYNELWSYDTDRDTWGVQLTGMPFYGRMGRKKKSKDGGAGAWYDDGFYAFKGGNTQEFWRYVPATDSWFESDTIPSVGSTGRKKLVKGGGDLVYNAYAFWGLKGNRTLEFWRYGILENSARVGAGRPRPHGVASSPFGLQPAGFSLMPNPLADGVACLRLEGCLTGRLAVRVFDATGRAVFSRDFAGRASTLSLDLRSLRAGVYLVQVETGHGPVWRTKLVRH